MIKPSSDILVQVSIPEYPVSDASNQRGERRFDVRLSGDFVTIGSLRFKKQDLDEALRVLGFKTGPTYRNADDARARQPVVPFDHHVGDPPV